MKFGKILERRTFAVLRIIACIGLSFFVIAPVVWSQTGSNPAVTAQLRPVNVSPHLINFTPAQGLRVGKKIDSSFQISNVGTGPFTLTKTNYNSYCHSGQFSA